MGNVELTILLIAAVAAFGWVIVRVVRGLPAGGESSARADTFAAGSGYAAEQGDKVRNFDR